jgi:hypothetical protein
MTGFLFVLVLTLHVLRLDGPWYWTVATMVCGALAGEALQHQYGQDEQQAADGRDGSGAAQ